MILLEDLFWIVIVTIVSQMVLRVLRGAMSGPQERADARPPGRPAGGPPQSVHMERDPVCGTYVVPERAISVSDGSRRVYFCSDACRDKYHARTA